MKRVIGITGGIATGKSTVLQAFAELGAEALSADDIAREVLKKGTPACRETIEKFGKGILKPDGEIDRTALARIIFNDPAARKSLEEITHPHIIREMTRRIDRFRRSRSLGPAVMAVEIPLLMECGLQEMVDEVVVVAAEQETQVDRLTSRTGITRDEALRRISSQMPLGEKIARADRVIWNDSTPEALRQEVEAVWGSVVRGPESP